MATPLERFRLNKDEFFMEEENSPLTPEQLDLFEHLDYFPENEALRFKLSLDRDAVAQDHVMLDTTNGPQQRFIPAGKSPSTWQGKRSP